MLFGEPEPTQADLHFRLFGFPIRVSPYFWVGILILKLSGGHEVEPADAAIWVAVVFVSILVHELGHAFLQRYYRGHPSITLYGFGGFSACGDCDLRPRAQIIIALAGPFAGFLFAAVIILLMILVAYLQLQLSPYVLLAVSYLIYVNIGWGIINLLPVYPLDGGRVSRQLFLIWSPYRGVVRSLKLSTIVGAIVAVLSIGTGQLYMCFMFAYLAYGSYQAVREVEEPWR